MNFPKLSSKLISTFILLLAVFFFTTEVKGQFIINGTAFQSAPDCYQLTPAAPGSIASIWNEDQISLSNSFDLRFNMNFGCTDIGADGMVFVLQTSPTALGQSGGDIGYGASFNPSFAVEFDTYNNIVNADFDADHIAILRNGNVDHNHPNNLAGPINASAMAANIEDCNYHPVQITWDADNMLLEVFFDCTLRLSYTGDIINDIFGGDAMVYWGFTGSTGGKTNVQSICFYPYVSTMLASNQDISICEGEDIQLTGSIANADYTWNPSTGLSDPNIFNPMVSPTENITYIGTTIDECGNEFIDTFNIIVNSLEINYELQPAFSDTTICDGEVLDLMVQTSSNNSIVWQDGSMGNSFTIAQPGFYEAVISNDCSTTTVNLEVGSTDCVVSMPNAFTPDGDGVNDFFGPVSTSDVDILQFKIFNRWGEVVFNEISQQGWDGTSEGKAAPSDVYVYTVEIINGNGTREFFSGDVTLIR